MLKLKEVIAEAHRNKVAVGHFNISNLEGFWAVVSVAREKNVPIIIGVSEGERSFIGIKQIVSLVKSTREEFNIPLFLNADHSYSFEKVKEAINAGFDSVIFDGAKLSLEENIQITKQCVDYARSVNPNIVVEGELGYIGESSKLLDELPQGVGGLSLTTPEDAKSYVLETGVDFFAPAVGNVHGMLKNSPEPRLDIDRVRTIGEVVGIPLVLHGASGNSSSDIQAAIEGGVSIVHINTEVRIAYRQALEKSLLEHPNEVAPYKIMKPVVEAMEEVIRGKINIFNRL